MNTFLAAVILIAFFGAVLALLEHNHHKTFGLPRAPLGTDVEADADLERVLHDLRAFGA